MQILRSLAVMLIGISMTACSSDRVQYGGAESLQMVTAQQLPKPGASDMQASVRPFRVGPFDKLNIDVFGIEELSKKEVQVDASGRINFPLIGTVAVAGDTPDEVAAKVQDLLRGRFIRNPQVSVNLKEIVSQTLTIGGEVKKPGVYPIVGRMSLMTAIASAEGWSDVSKKGAVVVFRTVNDKQYAAIYNVRGIERGNYPDPELFASDIVMVGESQSRKIWKDVLGAAPLLAPVIYLLRNKP